jgi:hypothetical protein
LVDTLSDLDATLTIGISYNDYGDAVTDALKVYNRVDLGALGVDDYDCISTAGVPAEDAMNDHIKANSAWKKCFDNFTTSAKYDRCFDNNVQPLWTSATEQYEAAKDGLEALRP